MATQSQLSVLRLPSTRPVEWAAEGGKTRTGRPKKTWQGHDERRSERDGTELKRYIYIGRIRAYIHTNLYSAKNRQYDSETLVQDD